VSRLFPQTPDWRLNRREASLSEIVQRFERIRRDTPDRPLVHHPATGATFTAENLWNAAAQYRTQLAALGLDREHLIVLIAGNRPAAVSLWLACRQLEVAVMPVDAGTPAAEVRALADRFGASVAILPVTFGGIEELGEICHFSTDLIAIRLAGITPRPQIYRGAAALKVTSGSTGLPKATFTREAQLVADTEHITTAMGIRPGDRQMAIIPLSHAYGLGNLLMPVLLQGTAIVLREAFVPQQFLADARTWDARVFHGVPFMFAHFVSSAEGLSWPSGLSRLISAGAPLDRATAAGFARTFGVKIHSFYGTTETGGISFDDSPDVAGEPTVGRAMPGVTITLRPEDGAPVDSGRVHVAGEAVSSGYAGLTAGQEGFVDDGFLTGDFGRFNSCGQLILTGRASSFINVAGRKVQPEEVEAALRSMPAIVDVRVMGVTDAIRGQHVAACVVTRHDAVTDAAIRQFCASRLTAHKVPRTIVRLDRIPLTERGKTDRVKLAELVREFLDRTTESGVL
jgi:acyl-CoA synthetase (AMP-forming)/AMP-acid ligase II